jgi:hypothetical protein
MVKVSETNLEVDLGTKDLMLKIADTQEALKRRMKKVQELENGLAVKIKTMFEQSIISLKIYQ